MIKDISNAPYFANPNKEYNEKHYKNLIALPARVLQNKEITNLSFFPLLHFKEFTDQFYYNSKILNGMNNFFDKKLNIGSVLLNSLTGSNTVVDLSDGMY